MTDETYLEIHAKMEAAVDCQFQYETEPAGYRKCGKKKEARKLTWELVDFIRKLTEEECKP